MVYSKFLNQKVSSYEGYTTKVTKATKVIFPDLWVYEKNNMIYASQIRIN